MVENGDIGRLATITADFSGPCNYDANQKRGI